MEGRARDSSRGRSRRSLVAPCAALVGALFAGAAACEVEETDTEHFAVLNHGVDEDAVADLVSWLEPGYEQVSAWGAIYDQVQIDVYADDNEYYDDLLAAGSGDPGTGSSGSVVEDRMFLRPDTFEGGGASFDRRVVIHELTHVMHLYNLDGFNVPEWHSEGLAEFVATHEDGLCDLAAVGDAVRENYVRPIVNPNSLYNLFAESIDTVYCVLASVHEFLVAEFGEEDLRTLVATAKDTPVFEDTLVAIYGLRSHEVEEQWLAWLP